MDDRHGESGADSTAPAGAPAEDSGVRTPVARVFADTLPVPTVTNMDGLPVELDAKVAAIRPSWWNRIWGKALHAAIIPESPSDKVGP